MAQEILHIYIRVSTSAQQEDGTSLKTQEEIGIELANKLDMLFQIHNEGGISSSKDTFDNRPVLMNILKMMDSGQIKNLYVWNTDRLSRNQITWYTIRQKMVKNGVVLYTSNGIHKTTDFMENMILGILSEVSQYDNKVRAERSRLGKIEKVKLNYWRGGDTPFGYSLSWDGRGNKLIENDDESHWVRFIYEEYSKGISLKNIKSTLEQNKIKTRRENVFWSMGSLQVILRNDVYLGKDEYIDKKTKLTIRNNIPQIISNKLWNEVQERRNLLLIRKNQINRTTKFYLFRDYLTCECGTPMGGRTKNGNHTQHYYCPLSERQFNNSYKKEVSCNMKRCLNIPTTDQFLWDKIVDILANSIRLKQFLKEKTLFGLQMSSKELHHEIQVNNERIVILNNTKAELEKGLVDIEVENITNKYPSDAVYHSLKRELSRRYNQVRSEIEDLNNSLLEIGNHERWFEWIDKFGHFISNNREIALDLKSQVLKNVLGNITVGYDYIEKVHKLNLHFKIPVIQQNNNSGKGNEKRNGMINPLETLISCPDQNAVVENYSTVTDLARFLGWSTLHPRNTAI